MPEFQISWVMIKGRETRSYRQHIPAEDADYASGVARRMADAIRLGSAYAWTLAPDSITAEALDPDIVDFIEGEGQQQTWLSGAHG